MKLRLSALIFTLGLIVSASAFAAEDGETDEALEATAVGCFVGCDGNKNQTNINSSPYQIDKQLNDINKDRSVIDPTKNSGAKRESWDI